MDREDLTTYKTLEEKGKKNKWYGQFLSWLWSSCVEVILQTIHNGTSAAPHSLPRIWWIRVGIANYLPFHAASDHSTKSTENTFHWAISSYTNNKGTCTCKRKGIGDRQITKQQSKAPDCDNAQNTG
jgi:hypothetical protein